jgi:hypothetical protein
LWHLELLFHLLDSAVDVFRACPIHKPLREDDCAWLALGHEENHQKGNPKAIKGREKSPKEDVSADGKGIKGGEENDKDIPTIHLAPSHNRRRLNVLDNFIEFAVFVH